MTVDRSIRSMTATEKRAKREWGTGVCQVRRCIARATYLVMETWQNESESGEWWQYCCKDHAQDFAERHGLDVPAASRGAECQTC